ncbi:MAG: exo-alpha-sialidase [Sedimentisphaerales bacterium]|nr:exo-alpha-sialidase [Sedimentisphaerales bacterium]
MNNNVVKKILWFALVVTACMSYRCDAVSEENKTNPVLLEVHKIWDQGKHNAFTDLIRFQDKWFCAFREADKHVGGEDGKIRIIVSEDGKIWGNTGLIAEAGVDLRDPKLSITPNERLMIVAGGSIYEGNRLVSRQPRVLFSREGIQWTDPKPVLNKGDWLWRVTWNKDIAYGVSYRTNPELGSPLVLFKSQDGIHYEKVCDLAVADRANETTLRFLADGTMLALVRRESGNRQAMIGSSRPPYTQWTWREAGHQVGGPNFVILPDGAMWAAGRHYPGGAKTVLAELYLDRYEPKLTLPSGGDTSYPGLVWYDGRLWMSYYSSHEGKTSIYLAKIQIPK